MSEAKYTPGPWAVSDMSIVSEEFCIAVIEDDGEYAAPSEQRKVNASLISASPALLLACIAEEEAYQHFASCEDCDQNSGEPCEAWDELHVAATRLRRAALAKARGGSAMTEPDHILVPVPWSCDFCDKSIYGESGRIWPDTQYESFEKTKGAEHRQCCLWTLGCLCVQAGVVWLLCWLAWGR